MAENTNTTTIPDNLAELLEGIRGQFNDKMAKFMDRLVKEESQPQNSARNEKWDRWYLELAKFYSTKSKDPSTKVGAVLVKDNRVVGLGYNGFPPGVVDLPERYQDRELKYKLVVHAEVNAVVTAGHESRGATLYVWPSFALPPICNECCKVAVTAGVARIVGYTSKVEAERAARWKDSIAIAKLLCDEAGVRYHGWPENE